MRLYEVVFYSTRFGSRYIARRVAVRGFVPDAIAKATKLEERRNPDCKGELRAEEVVLVGAEG